MANTQNTTLNGLEQTDVPSDANVYKAKNLSKTEQNADMDMPVENQKGKQEEPMETNDNGSRFVCSNTDCCRTTKEMLLAPLCALTVYDIPRKNKNAYMCTKCYETAVEHYEEVGTQIVNREPLHLANLPPVKEFVEILNSSDEEDNSPADEMPPLPPNIIALVDAELNEAIETVMKAYSVDDLVRMYNLKLKKDLDECTVSCTEMNETIKLLRHGFNDMQQNLNAIGKYNVRELPPIHFIDDQSMPKPCHTRNLSAIKFDGSLQRPTVQVNEVYFGVRGGSLLGSWNDCKVMHAVEHMNKPTEYEVQFLHGDGSFLLLSGKHLAYTTPPNVKLPMGTRVIAKIENTHNFHPNGNSQKASANSFYAGIVGETLNVYNFQRYLIIFDNGYTLYAQPWNVRVVCQQSESVWEDVDDHTQQFVKEYLINYKTARPMLQVKQGQRVQTEKEGKWHYACVLRIDSSLVLLHFPELKRSEWMFRGSRRFAALFYGRKHERQQISKFQKRNIPSIEYITIDDDDDDKQNPNANLSSNNTQLRKTTNAGSQAASASEVGSPPTTKPALAYLENYHTRVVARKSTAGETNAPPQEKIMNTSMIYCINDTQGETKIYSTKNYRGPMKYVPHECSCECLFEKSFDLKTYHLLARPLISGWDRQVCKARGKKTTAIVYRAPCGRRLRYMYEVHRYIRLTKATLNVECFDFDPDIRALAQFKAQGLMFEDQDLSRGKELMPVSCVNNFDDTQPPPCEYSTVRIPTEGVNLNLEEDFLCGCDCEDDCFDKSKCQCWQLTVQGVLHSNPNTHLDDIGYVYKRLSELVLTGIYECNSRCKCKVSECLNRVVQHPLQTKLQVFKTADRGWGIRCLNDIPQGSFICIYTGHLLTEETSNFICQQNEDKAGDEYFADLDYIEIVAEHKDGYENEALEPDWDQDDESNEELESPPEKETQETTQDSDDDFTSKSKPSTRVVNTRAQLKLKNSSQQGNKPGEARERVDLIPNSLMDTEAPSDTDGPTKRSVRKLFGENEQIYIMDAKKSGNLGRYFNHSCGPNLFVQNVFVDTHDLRFPWVAFFASRNIQAGSELTWNYHYDVGSVPGKVLYCNCKEAECRKRLL